MMALCLGVGKEFFFTTQNSQMIKGKDWSIWLHENEQFCSPKDNRDEVKNLIIVLGEDIFIWKHITIKHICEIYEQKYKHLTLHLKQLEKEEQKIQIGRASCRERV